MKDLTKGNITKLILMFSLPLLLGNIFQLFYNLADTRIVGQTLGKNAIAALGATSSVNTVIIGFLNGLRVTHRISFPLKNCRLIPAVLF